ncbi:Peptide chain release factor 1-like, mitochondrial [Chamberlinius hualienensis]
MLPLRTVKNLMKVPNLKLIYVRLCSNENVQHWLVGNQRFQSFLKKTVQEFENISRENVNATTQIKKENFKSNFHDRSTLYDALRMVDSQHQFILLLKDELKANPQDEALQKQIESSRNELDTLIERNLASALLPATESINEIQLELTAGVGGDEAMLFTADLLNMYQNYFMYKGWRYEMHNCQMSELKGVRHAIVSIQGENVYHKLKFEGGVHRVQRIPQTEKSGRVHTSTSSVAIQPQPSKISVKINDQDLKIETKRASGAGGQHVNKTESAIRMMHIPSGLVVECQTSRSQIQNRAEAKRKLEVKLYQQQFEAQLNKQQSSRKVQVGTSGRSEKIRTYNYMQDRITDHRINVTHYHLKEFMKGEDQLDRMINALMRESLREIILEAIYVHDKNKSLK